MPYLTMVLETEDDFAERDDPASAGEFATAAGIDAARWTPRELRHSFVSLLSDEGVPIEQIARLIGEAGGSA